MGGDTLLEVQVVSKVQVLRLGLGPLLLMATQVGGDAPDPEKRSYQTLRTAAAPQLDGLLDDHAWETVEWSEEFVQREPTDGAAPTRQTRFKVLYDDQAVYFAFRAFDDPAQVKSLLARRDRFPGDWVEVNIDSYFDHRTAFSFTLSLSGSRGDEAISNDGDNWDGNWDPIWEGATHVDEEGWTGEMRIPLSQLRFNNADQQTWGLQVTRRIFRQEERSTWQRIPRDVSGWVSRFGELRGVDGLRPKRRFEMLPYGVAKAERSPREAGNPFADGGDANVTGGLDGKLGVSTNLTMNFTLNPDFGQVEADPSEVNLTAFETFFEEKRPFFVEGNDIFELRLAPAITGGDFTRDRLFYSRRIGGSPPHEPDLAEGEHARQPDTSSILGAFKLSGKTAGGLSIGVLESLTSREQASIELQGLRRSEDVAPLTNYFVGRVQQDLRGGDTQVGLMFTSVVRDVHAAPLDFLTDKAWAGGLDFKHYFNHRDFLLEGDLLASLLQSTPQAIDEAQTSSARYFQRPDHDHASYDPSRTSLGGHAGSLRLSRTASNSGFRMQTGVAWRSPGFEINDLGFMNRADEINQFGWAAYQWRNPFSIFRRLQWNANEWVDWDSSGRLLRKAVNTNANANFKNNARIGGGLTREFERLSNTELRGGPSSRWPGRWSYEVWGGSDSRKPLYVDTGWNGQRGDEGSLSQRQFWLDLTYRPTNALTVTLSPSFSRSEPELQYVDTQALGGEDRYLFGRLSQKTSSLTLRLDLAITPNLTVQYYGAPFVSTGRYSELKRIVDPRAATYADRFRVFDSGQIALNAQSGDYDVDEDRDGRVDYSFAQPDFDFREFRSTLVARWEYRPGSQVFLVWSQGRVDENLTVDRPTFRRGLNQLFDTPGHDVFLIKFSKWFSL